MPLFQINGKKLKTINEKKIELEKDIQSLTEQNLSEIFGLTFVKSELQLGDLRIDTLAFDESTGSFVILEYKRDRSFSIIDQGFAYLSLMLNQKAEFILEYNEQLGQTLKREDIDWSQSRVLFIANSFTVHQQNAINFKDLPIQLWEVKVFENGTLLYNQIKAKNAKESISKITDDQVVEKVSREIKSYSIDDHFKEGSKHSRELFDELEQKVTAVDSRIEVKPTKIYIGFNIGRWNIAVLKVYRNKLGFEFGRTRPEELNDPEKKVSYMENSYEYFHHHVSRMNIEKPEDIDYAVFIMKQVYKKFLETKEK
jgi:predicted transport protein